MYESFQAALKKETANYTDDSFGVFEFALRSRMRTRTATNPYQVFQSEVLPFTPGLTKDFMNRIASIPLEHKENEQLMKLIYRRHYPGLTRFLFCPTGHIESLREVFFDPQYVWWKQKNKFLQDRFTSAILAKLGIKKFTWEPSAIVRYVLKNIEADHPDLDPQGMRNLKPYEDTYEKKLLYYWQLWRWLMEGVLEEKMKPYFENSFNGQYAKT